MDRLIQWNEQGVLKSADKGGFWDARKGIAKRCYGLYRFLNERAGLKSSAPKKSKRGGRVRQNAWIAPSSLAKGLAFHRHIYHRLFCTRYGACQCKRPFGRATIRKVIRGSLVESMVEAATRFVRDYQLIPYAGELVLGCNWAPIATRIDAIFTNANKEIVLVSWKSGRGGSHQDNADEFAFSQAQLAAEWALLEQTHGVSIARAYLVYASAWQNESVITPTYTAYLLSPSAMKEKWNDICARAKL